MVMVKEDLEVEVVDVDVGFRECVVDGENIVLDQDFNVVSEMLKSYDPLSTVFCYWERKEEVQQASKHQSSSNSNNNKSGGSGNNSQPKTGQDKSKTGSNNNTGSTPKPGNSNNSNSSKPKPSKLGKDGKLTPEERKRHIDRNLCMFCGGSSHFADKCPKKTRKAKARAAATTKTALASASGTTPETKK
ncbi:hypothetical protein M404DRAFT_36700 [Pisolithus tinctorius Marx 270]|uniref:CCHC-type domain-containing protein n=1 Tax=Pisolithus tinctorius Marx 270 TaxID=870435 RepID=A0A0C3MV51_PISTI|nr:hypothetical protein M404DRAFT_36700 [Pisolithus tinctorius Marx 270]